jgi:sugar phosphate isomerase/epimerase
MAFPTALGCSTISFRHLGLPEALATMERLGFREIDLGALPGVCDHVPYVLDEQAVQAVAQTVNESGLAVRSINADIGDLNAPLDAAGRRARSEHLTRLLDLAEGTEAQALVLPCGALSHEPVTSLEQDLDRVADELHYAARSASERGVELWVESLHFWRLSWNGELAAKLHSRLDGTVGVVMDFSHLVASGTDPVHFVQRFGDRIRHVHLRDAVPGDINLSIGNGNVDFAAGILALQKDSYPGHYALELETRDITNDEREDAAARAAQYISELLRVPSLSGEKA